MSEYLPVEVMVEILKRLPVKSVVKCRSVCKTWNNLIKTPSFISTHLQTSLSKPHNHLFFLHKWVTVDRQTFSLHFDDDDNFDEFKQLPLPVPIPFKFDMFYFRVIGSCNGLVCLSHYETTILDSFIWNPSIRKYITLPKLSLACLSNDHLVSGFGFDLRTNDYKLLILQFENSKTFVEAYLFSLNENSWKRVTAIFPGYAVERQVRSTFVNGAFHWAGYQREMDVGFCNMILGFDISTEEYFVIKLPESLVRFHPMQLSIMKYDESSISVVLEIFREDDVQIVLWVMKQYGVVGSWTKVLRFNNESEFGVVLRILEFRKSGEVLLKMNDREIVSLDLNCQQMKHLGIQVEALIWSANSYVESLLLLDKGLDAGV